jgi:hypothetical protein
MDRVAEVYGGVINEIEDFLEYRYKVATPEQIKATIMGMIDDGVSKLKKDKGDTKCSA